ncbi:MBG domain-containing protein [Stakelama saccharophila]|uniref:MBG domain-containing protein n=1 Tax=Stakelama saccharophila TaxID=3075605 RepID=A0ABZ0B9Z9_9SPHN|nr:MBG domain-containing protein [Stakelama sp. W311]WNO54047.1 MBG domain-containing protein [Stakelama sp. W311]
MTRKFAFLLATTGLVPFVAPAAAQTLPQGGAVVRGDATIGMPSGGALGIDQHSERAIINWNSFSVGKDGRVDIRQPDAQAALLNRVTGDATSRIAGQISANGQVYLVNPNGIFITKSGSVDAAGFVASTLDIGNDDFMAGEIVVTGKGGSVANAGTISIAHGGYAALVGGEVSNSGLIAAPMGKVALGAGTRATLDFEGDGFLQVALPEDAASTIGMSGRIEAQGGSVILSAADARAAARGVVNMSGVIAATGVEGRDGAVRLTGGDVALSGADIDVSGAHGGGDVSLVSTRSMAVDAASTIAADATASGTGGDVFIWSDGDTSAKGTLSARGISEGGFVETSGKTVDFAGITVDTSAAAGRYGEWLIDPLDLIIGQAYADSVSEQLLVNNITLETQDSGPDAGDIIVNGAISWDAGTTLTLSAHRNITVNAGITVAGNGGVSLLTGQGGSGGDYRFGGGASLAFTGSGGSLSINGADYALIRSMAELDAIDSTGLSGRYALAGDVEAAGVTYTRAIVGEDVSSRFTGTFTGLGHTISNLTIEAPDNDYIGLFGFANDSTLRDVGMIGGSVIGSDSVGAIAGIARRATIRNVYSTGSVSGDQYVGGLIGFGTAATVTNAYTTGAVASESVAGGLMGYGSDATVSNVYATGAVSGTNRVGGLIGNGFDAAVSNAYATGAVSGTDVVGGLIGNGGFAMISNAYFDTGTTGQNSGIGSGTAYGDPVTGLTTAQLQSGSATFSSDAFAGGTGGLYPYLASFFPGGVETIDGTFADAAGAVSGAAIRFYSGGDVIGTASTGANGYYYAIVQPGILAAGQDFGSVLTLDHGQGATGVLHASDYTLVPGGNLLLTIGQLTSYSDGSLYSEIVDQFPDTFGGAFEADWANLDPFVHTTGNLALDRALTVADGETLGLIAGGDLLIGEDITVDGAGAVLLGAGGDYRFAGASLDYGANDQGGTLSIDGAAYDLIYSMAELDDIDATGLGGNYALATDLDASGTTYNDALVGSAAKFTGTFTGLGHTISDLRIDAPDTDFLGLFGRANGTVRDIGMVGGTVSGRHGVGGLIGGGDFATISNAYATGVVSGVTYVGGLIGDGRGVWLSNAYATGAVSGSDAVGGLIGLGLGAKVFNGYAAGAVSGVTYVGGLIGDGHGVWLSNAYATGAVSGSHAVGGLIGLGSLATIRNAYFDTQTTGQSEGVGFDTPANGPGTGLTTTQLQNGDATFSGDAFAGGTGGLYPYLASFHPDGVRAITGFVRDGDSNALSAALVSAYAGRDVLDNRGEAQIGTAISGANGYYYVLVPGDALDDAGSYSVMAGDVSDFDALLQTDRLTNDTVLSGNLLTDSVWRILTDAPSLTEAFDGLGNAPGSSTSVTTFHVDHEIPGVALELYASGPFTIDDEIMFSEGGDVTIDVAAGDLTLGSGVLTGGDITLITRGAFINESTSYTPLKTRDHRWLIYSANPDANVYGRGLDSGNTAVWNTEAGDTVTQAGNRYVFAYQPTITVSAVDASKTYGDAIDLSASYDRAGIEQGVAGAYLGDDYATILSGAPALASAGAAAGADTGDYAISLDQGALSISGGYKLALGPDATLSVARRALTISADDLGRIYGDANPALSYTAGDLVNGDTLTGSLATDADARSDVGDYAITQGTLTAGDNYAINFTTGTLSVTPRHIDVTALGGSSIYGEAPADPGFAATNLASFDTVAALTGLASSFGIDGTTDAGSYTLTVDGALTNGNYVIDARTAGTWTVGQRALTITANDLHRIYGDANPGLTWTVGGMGLVNGDELTGALATDAVITGDVGSYAIEQGTLAADSNYDVIFTPGTLTIDPRHITVTALGGSSIYGEAAVNPGLLATGLADFDDLSVLTGLSNSFGIDRTTDAGSYTLMVDGTLTNGNYVIDSRIDGTWTVGRRSLTIAANDLTRIYGDANPALTYTLGGLGLVNGDTLSGALVTDAEASSDAGGYAIGQGSLGANGNYDVSFTGGTLTVTPRHIDVTALDGSSIYGEAATNPGLSATNLAGFDDVSVLTGLSNSFGIDRTTDAGSYTLTVDGELTNGNYAIDTRTAGTWTVGQRALTISADDLGRIYGDANPVLAYTVGGMGLANGDGLRGSLATDANAGSDVGDYAIDLGTLTAGDNYAVTFEGGTLSVTPRLLAIAGADFARTYGLPNPPLTYEIVDGTLVNGDRLTGHLATEAAIDSLPGLYRITRGTLTAGGNYDLRFEPGTARIAPLHLDFVTAGMLPFVRGQSPTAILPAAQPDPVPCLPQRYCEW